MDVNKRQSEDSDSGSRKRHSNDSEAVPKQTEGIFANMFVYFLPTGLGKVRLNVLKAGVANNGGCVAEDYQRAEILTHVVADDSLNYDRISKLLDLSKMQGSAGSDPVYAKISWVCECLRQKVSVDVEEYRFIAKKTAAVTCEEGLEKIKSDDGLNDIGASGATDGQNPTPSKIGDREFAVKKASFACSQSSGQQTSNFNQHITDKLEALAVTFKTNKDQWRAMSYQHAVSALKNHPKEVTSWEEARALPRVGERLADKIWEIIESGRLRKMEEICNSETNEALNLFMNIWGVGPNTAQLFVQQGFRTLEDIEAKADLNRQQRIGLKHYWDILDRMPRVEAAEIEKTVREAALNVQSGLKVMACGSYRRGNGTCGDVDVLITHPDGKSHQDLLPLLLASLHSSGFLTNDLVSHDNSGHQHKYLGVCKLPGESSKHRRLDIIIVPYPEFACSLLYFTGSAHFNRSMRLLARKMGMTLSEHSLNAGVVRRGQERICNGTPLPTPTEESVFEHLGIPYRPPEERNH